MPCGKYRSTLCGGSSLTKKALSNIAASVRQRLLNIAKERSEDFQRILGRYALERFLYRLSCHPASHKFILKGALLFEIWEGSTYRPTRDADLLGVEKLSINQIKEIFSAICRQKVENDGLEFDPKSIRVADIREDQINGGIRVNTVGHLGQARITLQFDIGFGDVVIPQIEEKEFPVLLPFPAPRLQIYSRYSSVAEKFQAIVVLGMANSRMKDYYDLYILSQSYGFEGHIIYRAIAETFKKRKTEFPKTEPLGLTMTFLNDKSKQAYWKAWLERINRSADELTLDEVIKRLQQFLMPPAIALANNNPFKFTWLEGGPWS